MKKLTNIFISSLIIIACVALITQEPPLKGQPVKKEDSTKETKLQQLEKEKPKEVKKKTYSVLDVQEDLHKSMENFKNHQSSIVEQNNKLISSLKVLKKENAQLKQTIENLEYIVYDSKEDSNLMELEAKAESIDRRNWFQKVFNIKPNPKK